MNKQKTYTTTYQNGMVWDLISHQEINNTKYSIVTEFNPDGKLIENSIYIKKDNNEVVLEGDEITTLLNLISSHSSKKYFI